MTYSEVVVIHPIELFGRGVEPALGSIGKGVGAEDVGVDIGHPGIDAHNGLARCFRISYWLQGRHNSIGFSIDDLLQQERSVLRGLSLPRERREAWATRCQETDALSL